MMIQNFVLLGGKDRQILLENATHGCPRCKENDTVQLTRFDNEVVFFNKKIVNSTNVLYNCHSCHWKSKYLPDTDNHIINDNDITVILALPDNFYGYNFDQQQQSTTRKKHPFSLKKKLSL